MKALGIYCKNFTVVSQRGEVIVFEMELFKIQGEEAQDYPEGFRLGWIAYSNLNPNNRILFDTHPPKGLHFHIDDDKEGKPIFWESYDKTEEIFYFMVCRHFDIRMENLK